MNASAWRRILPTRGYEWLLSLAFAILLVGIIYRIGAGAYCERCGWKRYKEHPLLTHRVWCRQSYSETEFHRLYSRFVSPTCDHVWRVTYSNHGTLLGGWHHRGGPWTTPSVLLRGPTDGLGRVRAFHERARAVAVLRAISLGYSGGRNGDILDALRELPEAFTEAEEARWWRKHQALIAGAPPK